MRRLFHRHFQPDGDAAVFFLASALLGLVDGGVTGALNAESGARMAQKILEPKARAIARAVGLDGLSGDAEIVDFAAARARMRARGALKGAQ